MTLQTASLTGIYGLSWVTVFVATAPALWVLKEKPVLPNALAAMLVVLMIVFGWQRLEQHPTALSTVKIRIVQANIPQAEKMTAEAQYGILKKYLDLTRLPGLAGITAAVWPEAAVPYYMQSGSMLLRDMGSILPDNGLLVTGGMRENNIIKDGQSWNSLFVLDHTGQVLAQYDKHHLVPFGEFIPLRHILPVETIAGGMAIFPMVRVPRRSPSPHCRRLARLSATKPYSPTKRWIRRIRRSGY